MYSESEIMKVILDIKEVRELKRAFIAVQEAMNRIFDGVEILIRDRISAQERKIQAGLIENKALLVQTLMGNLDETYSLEFKEVETC